MTVANMMIAIANEKTRKPNSEAQDFSRSPQGSVPARPGRWPQGTVSTTLAITETAIKKPVWVQVAGDELQLVPNQWPPPVQMAAKRRPRPYYVGECFLQLLSAPNSFNHCYILISKILLFTN
uniref:Uncharacterized protein n=1 Tax=Glossina palpalis gambiensis TaxID=67801 RepID=A0A1B0B621_9MUSC